MTGVPVPQSLILFAARSCGVRPGRRSLLTPSRCILANNQLWKSHLSFPRTRKSISPPAPGPTMDARVRGHDKEDRRGTAVPASGRAWSHDTRPFRWNPGWHARCISSGMRSSLSNLETDRRSIQDDLPADVMRLLQVEESWAHRTVLADLMNAERLELYASKRALLWPALLKPQELQRERKPAFSLAGVVPFRGRKASV